MDENIRTPMFHRSFNTIQRFEGEGEEVLSEDMAQLCLSSGDWGSGGSGSGVGDGGACGGSGVGGGGVGVGGSREVISVDQHVSNNLLIVALLDQLSSLYIEEDQGRKQLFLTLVEELVKSGILPQFVTLGVAASLRTQYTAVLTKLVQAAVSTINNQGLNVPRPTKNIEDAVQVFLQPRRPRQPRATILDEVCMCIRRYNDEFTQTAVIDSGAFGSVFKVTNNLDGCEYAIKKIPFELNSMNIEVWNKIVREVKMLAQTKHKNVVRYYSAWMEVMPLHLLRGSVRALPDVASRTRACLLPALPYPTSSTDSLSRSEEKGEEEEGEGEEGEGVEEGDGEDESIIFKDGSSHQAVSGSALLLPPSGPSPPPGQAGPSPLPAPEAVSPPGPPALTGPNSQPATTAEAGPQDPGSPTAGPQSESPPGPVDLPSAAPGPHTTSPSPRPPRPHLAPHHPIIEDYTSSSQSPDSPPAKLNTTDYFTQKFVAVLHIQMELCDSNLKDWLEKRNYRLNQHNYTCVYDIVNEEENLRLLKQILKAVDCVHSKGLIHRDIKPKNIFLAEEGVARLGDFGLARDCSEGPYSPGVSVVHPEAARTSSYTSGIGTTLYAAPEQLNNNFYDEKCDIYSLGVVLYELYQPFSTTMERVACLEQLRKTGLPPNNFTKKWPKQAECVTQLLMSDSRLRPAAQDLLNSHLFLSKDQVISDLKLENRNQRDKIVEMERELRENEREMRDKDREIERLRRELQDRKQLEK